MVNHVLISFIIGLVIGCLPYRTKIWEFLQKIIVIISKGK